MNLKMDLGFYLSNSSHTDMRQRRKGDDVVDAFSSMKLYLPIEHDSVWSFFYIINLIHRMRISLLNIELSLKMWKIAVNKQAAKQRCLHVLYIFP